MKRRVGDDSRASGANGEEDVMSARRSEIDDVEAVLTILARSGGMETTPTAESVAG